MRTCVGTGTGLMDLLPAHDDGRYRETEGTTVSSMVRDEGTVARAVRAKALVTAARCSAVRYGVRYQRFSPACIGTPLHSTQRGRFHCQQHSPSEQPNGSYSHTKHTGW
jgi:hypothetical protein